jgi:hypothetical protein
MVRHGKKFKVTFWQKLVGREPIAGRSCRVLKRALLFLELMVVLAVIFPASSAFATIDASLQMELGNPSGAITDTNNHNHYLIQRTVEAMDYSDNLGQPLSIPRCQCCGIPARGRTLHRLQAAATRFRS